MKPASPLNIIVLEAHTVGSVAVIRSLGRAGHIIHSFGSNDDSIGFYSSYTSHAVVNHPYNKKYVVWLRKYIVTHQIDLIIPSEGFLLTIKNEYDEFSKYLPINCDKETTYKGMCKWELFDLLKGQNHLPNHLLIEKKPPNLLKIDSLSPPYFLKLDAFHQIKPNDIPSINICNSAEEALDSIHNSLLSYNKILVQQYVEGIGCGVFFLIWNDQIIAHFMHNRVHEVPHTGGASSLRKSWWHDKIYQDAARKVKKLGWQGVVMVEYRWNPETDDFYLMEMNCRFWGSLHLALHADVDFPALLVECFQGKSPSPIMDFPINVYSRYTFPREIQYVWSRLKDKNISIFSKIYSILEFFWLSLNPNIKSDYWFHGDRQLFWKRLKMFMRTGD